MAKIIFIGDEVTAAGYRLAGAETLSPGKSETADLLRQVLGSDVDLILLSAELTSCLPAGELRRLLFASKPLVSVVADVFGEHRPPALNREVRLALGIEA